MSAEQTPPDGPGIRLSRAFFQEIVAPPLAATFPGLRYDAALVGNGSEVLGFDTARSADHGYGPRLQIFLADDRRRDEVTALLEDEIPPAYGGFATRFDPRGEPLAPGDHPRNQVVVTDARAWSVTHLGVDATRDLSTIEWLGVPWQQLATATAGAVFHADLGDLDAVRARIAWYPGDVWRYVLAGQWLRIAQEEAFVGRAGEVGDDLGSAMVASRLVREVVRLTLLLRRRYPPYAKWLGSAFARLSDAATLGPILTEALRGTDWRTREQHLCEAYEYVATVQNGLGLCVDVDPACRGYYDRPFRVIGGQRFANALRDAIAAPEVRALPLIGSIDEVADSTDVLSHSGRSAVLNRALFASAS